MDHQRLAWLRRPAGMVADIAVAVVLVVLMQAEIWVFDPERLDAQARVLAAVVTPVAGAALAFRRTHPAASFSVNGLAVYILIAFAGPSNSYQFTNLIALYSIAFGDRRRLSWLALPLSLLGVWFYFVRFPEEGGGLTPAMVILIWVVVWLMGRLWGATGERERLRTERDLSAELAEVRQTKLELEAERTEMARELHDILGHTLNVMLVHAGAARRALPANPAQATEAIEIVETTGRSAMDDLDRVLGFLRPTGEATRNPLPGLGDLHDLATSTSDSDLRVAVDLAPGLDTIPKPLQLTAYRIAQEALTNVIKHAGAASAAIIVARRDGDLTLEVRDDGRGIGPGTEAGRGLTGIEQRASLHGGTLTTSSEPGRGTTLRCRLPVPSP